MSEKSGYTPGQASEMLDIPDATLRRYARSYAAQLSEGANRASKSRRYTDQDILILRKIRQLTRERKTPAEVIQLLQVLDDQPPPSAALALIPQIAEQFEAIRARLIEQDNEITELRQRIADLETPWYKRLFKRPD